MKMKTISLLEEIVSLDPEKINLDDKEAVKKLIQKLLNVIETLAKSVEDLKQENQGLKDEINRLKGEKGKPQKKPDVPRKENNLPNEKKISKKWKKRGKKQRIKIDKTETLRVDRDTLPPDAEHKGYRSVTVQNIRFETDNIEYRLERYYSPGEHKVYEAELPDSVDGEFGADLKAFIHYLYFACRVPEKKIWKTLTERGIIISEGHISNILTRDRQEEFSKEKEDILKAGMTHSNYFHIDDTGARHKSISHYVHVICTALFSAFFIRPRKNRDTVKGIIGINDDEQIEKILISDDAKQFMNVVVLHALCWLHEIRHYRKMNPVIEYHRAKLVDFLTRIWNYYDMLRKYRKNPDGRQKEFLERKFDELFSTETGYEELDRRIGLTRGKKDRLLLVLTYPEIPLHNNPAEIAVREFVIKKGISYGTRSEDGRIAWENMMSILDTCRKQGISFLDYVTDIYSGQTMPRLADLIVQKGSVKPTDY